MLYNEHWSHVDADDWVFQHQGISSQTTEADQKNSLVSGPPTDPATTPPTVNFLQQSEQKVFLWRKKKC